MTLQNEDTTMDIDTIRTEMLAAAREAAENKIKEYGGDRYACGFAWTTVYPKFKGNTRQGKEERKILASLGFRKDWTGKNFELWNPSGAAVQSVDIKETGAEAAAQVLRKHGLDAWANSRLD
jgi:hypothetical protein